MEALQLDAQDYVFPVETRSIFKNKNIIKAIHASQHTQRNYDLDKKIPIEDIKTIITAATQCPSKQNLAFYDLHVIVRDLLRPYMIQLQINMIKLVIIIHYLIRKCLLICF